MGAPILFLFLIIYLIASSSSKAKKQQSVSKKPQAAPVKKASSRPAQQAPMQAQSTSPKKEEQLLPNEPIKRAQISVHVSEHHHEDMYAGSMKAAEIQGDPDNYDQMPSEHSAELFTESGAAHEPPREGLRLDFTGSSLVNAIIMQEVLKRPTFRRS